MKRFPIPVLLITLHSSLFTIFPACGGSRPANETIGIPLRPEVALFLASAVPLTTEIETGTNLPPLETGVTCRPGGASVTAAPSPAAPTTVEECTLDAAIPEKTLAVGAVLRLTVARVADGVVVAKIMARASARTPGHRFILRDALVYLPDDDGDGVSNALESVSGYSPLDPTVKPETAQLAETAGRAARRLQPLLGTLPPLKIDLIPPQAWITKPEAGSGADEFSFSSPDASAVFLCSVDGSDFEMCFDTLRLDKLTDGTHQVETRAVSPLGSAQKEPTVFKWEQQPPATPPDALFDLTAPNPPDSLTLSMDSFGEGKFILSWPEASDDFGVLGYRVWYDSDGPGPPYSGTGFREGSSPIFVPAPATRFEFTGAKFRPYYFAVTALDHARRESAFTEEVNTFLPPAEHVIGQADFTAHAAGLSASTFDARGADPVRGLGYDPDLQRLFVSDYYGHRVLVFSLAAGITDGMSASNVLGAPDFTTRGAGCSPSSLLNPASPAYDPAGKLLFVPQEGASRISVFELGHGIHDGMSAAHVLGQRSLSSCDGGTGRSLLSEAASAAYSGKEKRLFVSDFGNNRVLAWELPSGLENGVAADLVLGQKSFTTNACGSDPAEMDGPAQILYDEATHRLFVADSGDVCGLGMRVLVFDFSQSVANGAQAAPGPGRTGSPAGNSGSEHASLATPRGIALDPVGSTLFISDSGNNRILVYDLASDARMAAYVIGQANFNDRAPGRSQTRLKNPAGLVFDPDHRHLFVADSGNNRVLAFRIP
ncbi:MAG: NHL repeat-containing protein [Nitrospirae bacterium]|nr:NHL repeat-containing protein [Nitrospirota bacterium]